MRMTMPGMAALAAVIALTAGTCRAVSTGCDLVLVERGRPCESVIVLPAAPSASQREAAEQLALYFERMTSVRPAIGPRTSARCAVVFRTSDTQGKDGYALTVEGDALVIEGSSVRGCLYGAYEVLERLGCRFLSPKCERVPTLDRIAFPRGFRLAERPAFRARQILYSEADVNEPQRAKLRCNSSYRRPIGKKYGGRELNLSKKYVGHTFYTYIPPKEYFAAHPEYFAMNRGKRVGKGAQLCLTNPDVLRITIEKIRAAMREEPEAQVFDVTPNDCEGYCECPKCKAIDDAEGSHAATYVAFLNAVAAAVAEEFPDNYVQGDAYWYTQKPPRTLRPVANVYYDFAPVYADFSASLDKSAYKVNKEALADMREWIKGGSGMFEFTDFVTNYRYYPIAFPNIDAMIGNARLVRDMGFTGWHSIGSHDSRGGFLPELRAWVQAKLLWDPDRDGWALVREFCDGFYGEKAGPIAYGYVKRLHELPRDTVRDPLLIFENCDSPVVTDEFLDWAYGEWTRAETLVKDDPQLLENVRFGKYSTVFHLLIRGSGAVWATADVGRLARQQELARWMIDFAETAGDPLIVKESGKPLKTLPYYQQWKRVLAADKSLASGRGVAEEDTFELHRPGLWLERADDPQAGNGKAIRLLPDATGWAVQFRLSELAVAPKAKCRIRAHVRVGKTASAEPDRTAFVMGVTDEGSPRRGRPIERKVKFSELGDGYAWVDLAELVPNTRDCVWFAMGGYQEKGFSGNPGLTGVWIDCLDFTEVR